MHDIPPLIDLHNGPVVNPRQNRGLVANHFQPGGLRDGIEDIAGQVLQEANIER
jgi:hypothetical protein